MAENWQRFPYAKKPYADSTLRNMTKLELIQIIRDYEHNYAALYETYERSIAYAEKRIRAAEEKLIENSSRLDSILKSLKDEWR